MSGRIRYLCSMRGHLSVSLLLFLQKGEITLFDLQLKKARDLACLGDCINSLQILSQPKRFSHLLVSTCTQ